MATSNVSAIDREEWQLIESKSASGTNVIFNAFSGYKHLWLTGKGITKSGSTAIGVQPNSNSTAGNYATAGNSGQNGLFVIAGATASNQATSFLIYDVDKTTPKRAAASYDTSVPQNDMDAFIDTVAVTSLKVFTYDGSSTFTGGTFYLYGIVA
jgi:hypothetical protein